jgi:glycogen synthase
LTRKLAELGHEVHVIAPRVVGSKKFEVKDNVSVHRIGFIHRKYFSEISYWVNISLKFKKIESQIGGFDVIHGNQRSDFLLRTNLPHVVTIHSLGAISEKKSSFFGGVIERNENNFIFNFAENYLMESADLLIANSQYTKMSILARHGFSAQKIRVIYPGVSIREIGILNEKTVEDFSKVSKKFIYDLNINDTPIILFVGRLVERKGLHFLLRALKILTTRKIKAKLVVVGDGPEKLRYIEQVRNMVLEQEVLFTGFVDDETLRDIYKSSRVVVVPSVNEPFGIVIVEAMVFEKPIVASKSGAIPEIIQSGLNGLLIDPQNACEFANAIEMYLLDAELSQKTGELNRRKIIENFTWSKAAEQTVDAYKLVMR